MLPTHHDVRACRSHWKYVCRLGLIACTLFAAVPAFAVAPADRITPTVVLHAADAEGTNVERAELRAIYENLGNSLVWATTSRQLVLIKLLASLESDGIAIERLGAFPASDAASQARADVLATRTILRAAHVIAGGAVSPEIIPGWSLKTSDSPVVDLIISAARNDRLDRLFDDLRPTASAYGYLRAARVRYLGLTGEAWTPLETSAEVHLEISSAQVSEIKRRLILLGDLREGDAAGNAATDAVKHFQDRHGLAVDGRLGPATLAALNVSPAAREEQIAVNLEYWRLLPRVWPKRYIAVNTAAARLAVMSNGSSTYTSRVIVGDPNHPTPVMGANIMAVTFNPSWTIPRSIAVKEILPRLRRDPRYLERNTIEILDRRPDPYGLQLDWRSYSQASFPYQLRQVPGPHNALGLVKFEMPNGFDVYLHDTPDKSLFEKSTRALSHGCVRVECANELAQRLIDNPAVWLESNLSDALKEGRTVTVPLAQPLPVYLLYFTAYAGDDGAMNFRPDVYGRDRAVRDALHPPLSQNPAVKHVTEGS